MHGHRKYIVFIQKFQVDIIFYNVKGKKCYKFTSTKRCPGGSESQVWKQRDHALWRWRHSTIWKGPSDERLDRQLSVYVSLFWILMIIRALSWVVIPFWGERINCKEDQRSKWVNKEALWLIASTIEHPVHGRIQNSLGLLESQLTKLEQG